MDGVQVYIVFIDSITYNTNCDHTLNRWIKSKENTQLDK